MKHFPDWPPTQRLLLVLICFCLTYDFVTSNGSQMVISNMCRPLCTFGTTCVERPSLCSFTNCPTYLSCIPTSSVPAHLLETRFVSQRPGRITPKAGCPTMASRYGPCITQCQRDMDCGQGQLCCPHNCGQLCRPDLRIIQVAKPGSCPRHLHAPNTRCESECESDHDCPGMQKCCLTSCGAKACTPPCFLHLTGSRWRQPRRCRRRPSLRSHRRRNKRKFRFRRRSLF